MPEQPPAPIPRRLVYRAMADALGGQARHFRSLPDRSRRRRPGVATDPARAASHAARARRLESQAAILSSWIGEPSRYRGKGLDAAVFGYLVAHTYGHGEALGELRAELADLEMPSLPEGLDLGDFPALVAALCPPIHPGTGATQEEHNV